MKKYPSFYAIIPAFIRYDKTLPPNVKLLYGEITALADKEGFCWATNSYFANLYGVHKNTVSNWFSKLNKKKYINIYFKELDNGVIQRRVFIGGATANHLPPLTKSFTPLNNNKEGDKQKDVVNSTTDNNTKNNTSISLEKNQNIPDTPQNQTSTPKTQTSQEKEKNCGKKEKEEIVEDDGLKVLQASAKLKQTILSYLKENPSVLTLIKDKAKWRGGVEGELEGWCDHHCDSHKAKTKPHSHFSKTFPSWLMRAKQFSRSKGSPKPSNPKPSFDYSGGRDLHNATF